MKKKKRKKLTKNLIFLGIVILIYITLGFINFNKIEKSLLVSKNILFMVLPIFLIVIIFMTLINLVPNKIIKKYLGRDSKVISWLMAILGGVFSHGPIYAWYSFLEEMEQKGMSKGRIATFLYSRAIKIPLLPLMVSFFGITFTFIYNIWLFVFSIIQGLIIDLIFKENKNYEDN